jgi:hypothetical protein
MSEGIDIRQVQRRVFQLMSFEDGLWDLLMGIIIMFLAIYPVTRERIGPEWNLLLFISLLAVVVVIHLVARYFVSMPRVGYAKLHQSPLIRILVIVTIVLFLITIGLVALTFFGPGRLPAPNVTAEASHNRSYLVEFITLVFMGGLFTAMGYLFGVTRLYFYGWMIGLAYLASVYMVHQAGWVFLFPLAVAAGIILLIGLVLLLRFLERYPVHREVN